MGPFPLQIPSVGLVFLGIFGLFIWASVSSSGIIAASNEG
jgi:hypothetical protein